MVKEWKYSKSNQKPVIFDHLPKCGGTTISKFLAKAYPLKYSFEISGHFPDKSVSEFQGLSEKNRFNFDLIYGHSANELFNYVKPGILKATVFREPIERIISHYYYVKRTPFHYLHERVIEENIGLEDYCDKNVSEELENWYTTHFTGLSLEEVEANPQKAIELAYQNILNTYDVIGFQDDIPGFMAKLTKVANITLPFENKHKNRTRNRKTKEEIDPAVLQLISKKNALDIELFNLLRENK